MNIVVIGLGITELQIHLKKIIDVQLLDSRSRKYWNGL